MKHVKLRLAFQRFHGLFSWNGATDFSAERLWVTERRVKSCFWLVPQAVLSSPQMLLCGNRYYIHCYVRDIHITYIMFEKHISFPWFNWVWRTNIFWWADCTLFSFDTLPAVIRPCKLAYFSLWLVLECLRRLYSLNTTLFLDRWDKQPLFCAEQKNNHLSSFG